MNRRKKLIILVLLMVFLAPIIYFGISILEEQTFYNGIKEISDIENRSDVRFNVIQNQTTPSLNDIKQSEIDAINTSSTEILMLQDLKSKVFKNEYKEFIDIQINRLTCENRTYTKLLDQSNLYEQYKNGEIGASRALSLIEDKNEEINTYANKTSSYKADADTFLSVHKDMKQRFNELGIDEDFLYDQIEEVKTEYIK